MLCVQKVSAALLAAREGVAAYQTYRIQRADGTSLWLETAFHPVPDEQGGVRQIQTISRDMSARWASEAAERCHQLELTLARIYTKFLENPNINEAINGSLADMGEVSGAGRSYLFRFIDGGTIMQNTHEWCAPGIQPEIANLQALPSTVFPWWVERLRRGENIHVRNVAELPTEATAEWEILEAQGIRSILSFPVHAGGQLVGYIGLDNLAETAPWTDEHWILLRVASEIIGSAILNHEVEDSLRRSEKRFRSLVQNSMEGVLVMDANCIMAEASAMRMRTVAEGVERTEQRDLLTQVGCQAAQGYLFARPLPARQVEAFLRAIVPTYDI